MFLDIGIGIIVAVFVRDFFPTDSFSLLVGVAIVFSLLPDLDFFLGWAKGWRGKNTHLHRSLFHVPFLYVLIVGIFVWVVGGWSWSALFVVLSLSHFLHDSVGIGWGVQWLRPFSSRWYKFLSDKNGSFKYKKFLVSWSDKELLNFARQHGRDDWFENTYLRITPTVILEVAVFLFAILFFIFIVGIGI